MKKDSAFLIALLAPIPSTLLYEYLKSLAQSSDLFEMRVILTALAGVFLGFLMAYVGDLDLRGYTFLKYLMALIYSALALGGIISLYVKEIAAFHHYQSLFLDHALMYLVWGGVYLSLLIQVGKKSSLFTYLAPFLCMIALYVIDVSQSGTPLLVTTIRYSIYILFGFFSIIMVNHFPDRHYLLYASLYLIAFLFFIFAPLFCELPAVLDRFIASTYILFAIDAGMNAYGLSNR